MATTTIRVSQHTHSLLHQLAREKGASMQDIVEQALDLYRREQLLRAANEAYAALRADPDSWDAYQQELADWNATVADGLVD
jgi:predicted transcriptional regulator